MVIELVFNYHNGRTDGTLFFYHALHHDLDGTDPDGEYHIPPSGYSLHLKVSQVKKIRTIFNNLLFRYSEFLNTIPTKYFHIAAQTLCEIPLWRDFVLYHDSTQPDSTARTRARQAINQIISESLHFGYYLMQSAVQQST